MQTSGPLLARIQWSRTGVREAPSGVLRGALRERMEAPPWGRVSLVTPCFNTEPRYLDELIATCAVQSYEDLEICLVDDASPNKHHLAVIRKWTNLDNRVRFLPSEVNLGIARARNLGFQHANGAYVSFIDHDDLIHPSALYRSLAALHLGSWDAVYSNESKINEAGTYAFNHVFKGGFSRFQLERLNYLCHLMVFRKPALARLGQDPFRGEFDWAEDHDLFLRFSDLPGIRIGHVPKFLYLWRDCATSTARNLQVKPEAVSRGRSLAPGCSAPLLPSWVPYPPSTGGSPAGPNCGTGMRPVTSP